MYSVFTIANWFLHKEPMTHKRLQKLCYYAYAWYYTLKKKERLYNDTRFEAWVHGPVSPQLFNVYSGSGWDEIHPKSAVPTIDKATEEILDSVWETYKGLTGNTLEALTHNESPWINARIGLSSNAPSKRKIKDEDIYTYYNSIYEGGEE